MKQLMKYIILAMIFVSRNCPLLAQEQVAAIKELKVGDQCPDFVFNDIINSKKPTARLSDFKGKLVIIDFFATWCGPCIAGLPKLDSLQQKFGDQIAILPVTQENKERVMKLLAANQTNKILKLPFITSNSELDKYFPHSLIPHEVWIDQNGIVNSITDERAVNAKNIEDFLNKQKPTLPQKSEVMGGTFLKPLIAGGAGNDYHVDIKQIEYSALVMGYLPGVNLPFQINYSGDMGFTKLLITNSPIEKLYQFCYAFTGQGKKPINNPNFLFTIQSRTLWEARDTTQYWNYGKNKSYYINNKEDPAKTFTFELIMAKKDSTKLVECAIQELNNYFGRRLGIEGVKEKRKVKCWVLKKISKDPSITTKGGNPDINIDQINYSNISITNKSINELLVYYAGFVMPNLEMPLVDDTGITGNVDLDITADLKNRKALNKALEKYSLEFVIAKRKIDMIIIKDQNK